MALPEHSRRWPVFLWLLVDSSQTWALHLAQAGGRGQHSGQDVPSALELMAWWEPRSLTSSVTLGSLKVFAHL